MTESTPSLAPDTEQTKQQLTDNLNSNQVVTAYSLALLNVSLNPIPGLNPQPDWFDTMQTNLAAAKQSGQYWIDTLGPQLFSTVPQSIINYSDTFNADTGFILQILKDCNYNPGTDQKDQILALLNNTLQELDTQQGAIVDAQTALVAFSQTVSEQHQQLVDGNNGALAALQEDQDQVIGIQGQIADLNAKLAADSTLATTSEVGLGVGIFIAVAGFALCVATGGLAAPAVVGGAGVVGAGLGIAGTTVWNIDKTNDLKNIQKEQNLLSAENAQISALQTIISTTGTLTTANESAEAALVAIKAMYETLAQKMQATINNVEAADNADIPGILQAAKITTAQTDYDQLTAFATQIEDLSVTNQGVIPAPGTPA
ncbi:MAG: HBL/NHE enterotoxin family protein [Sulfuricellaceae bacterium]|nr:HBL/NHE enterotoxin family protein [Sulfuricellaceae bacterium]